MLNKRQFLQIINLYTIFVDSSVIFCISIGILGIMDWHFQQEQIWYLLQMQARFVWKFQYASASSRNIANFITSFWALASSFLSNKIVKNNNNGGTFYCRLRNLSSTSVNLKVIWRVKAMAFVNLYVVPQETGRSIPPKSKLKRQSFFDKPFDIFIIF